MKDKDKVIVVFYLGTLGIDASDLSRLLSETCDYYANQFDETVKQIQETCKKARETYTEKKISDFF